MRHVSLLAFGWFGLASLGGCSSRPTPLFASSANESAYAERYPAALLALRTEFSDDETHARELFSGFATYPGTLSATDGREAAAVVARADAAGKSSAYAQALAEHEHVARFFAEEKDTLNQKVAGAAQYAAKQKECTVDVGSPAAGALDRGIDKAQEERLRGHNEADRYIEDHVDALGKSNAEKLQKQADDIALASYLVHVRVKELKAELARQVDEAPSIKKTLERTSNEAEAVLANHASSRSAKATARERVSAGKTASASLDSEVEQTKRVLNDMDARSDKLEKDYQAALDALERTLIDLPKKG